MKSQDRWTAHAYTSAASFVPKLTEQVLQWLDPLSSDHIIDLGCGDGVLTAKIAQRSEFVLGLDSSANLLQAAHQNYGSAPGHLEWKLQDCRHLCSDKSLSIGVWDKVFSNAALHWILSDLTIREAVLTDAHRLLKPHGTFVFEMGGAGNVAEVHTALIAALVHQGIPLSAAQEASPWYFPSEKGMKEMLETAGFVVEKMELQYRPTRLTDDEAGGLGGWVRLMGKQFLEVLGNDNARVEAAVQEVEDVLQTILTHEDGSMWLGYVRLRVLARKPSQ